MIYNVPIGPSGAARRNKIFARAELRERLHVHRRLAAAAPAAYEPDLAGALNSLGTACRGWAAGRRRSPPPRKPSPSIAGWRR
jgi:hypothetical protein